MTMVEAAGIATAAVAVLGLVAAAIVAVIAPRERIGTLETQISEHARRLDRHHRWAELLDRKLEQLRELMRSL